jgi:hypothetical protein
MSFETLDCLSPTAQSVVNSDMYINRHYIIQNCLANAGGSNKQILDISDDIPNEKSIHYQKKLRIPNSPVGPKRKSGHRPRSSKANFNDETQKTLKSNFKPILTKNYKNFYKYKSNILDNSEDKDITPEIIENTIPKSRNKTNNNSVVNEIPKEKAGNVFERIAQYLRNLRK